MTMSDVRSLFWIPHLRRLSKSVIRNCYGCKKFRSLPYHSPKPGPLPKDRTEKFSHRLRRSNLENQKEKSIKAYVLLFSCSVTRTVHSELVSNVTTTEFIGYWIFKSFRILNSRRVQPQTVYSDNAKTFKVGVKWLANINKDQKLHDILSSETVIWKFSLPKAQWWGWSIWTANWPN